MDLLDAIDQAWDFSDPEASEVRFRALEDNAEPLDAAEIQTQRARTLGLRKKFAEARSLLQAIPEDLIAANPRLQCRVLLEMGRTYNSEGNGVAARPLFLQAFEAASQVGIEWLAIDAGHMVAIASEPEEALEWNQKCLSQAEQTTDARARKWRGSLLNNIGWTLMDMGRPAEALEIFERAVPLRVEAGAPGPLRIAKWCVGRAMRELGRCEEALVIQTALLAEGADGFADEEAGECLHALGRTIEAKPFFQRAFLAFTDGALEGAVKGERLARIARLMA